MPLRVGIDIRVADPPGSGQARYLWRLGRWLGARAHEVHFLAARPTRAVVLPPSIRLHSLHALRGRAFREYVAGLELDVLLINPERSRRYRGIHANVLRPGYGTEHFQQKLNSFRTPLSRFGRRALRAAPWVFLERRWERAFYEGGGVAPQVIAVSRLMREAVLRSYDVPSENVHVIHNGVDLDEFNPGRCRALRAAERARLGIPPDAFALLFMGHNYRLKGLWPLVDAISRARREGAAVHLIAAGRGTGAWQRAAARRLIARSGLHEVVHLVGTIQPAVRAFAAADAFVHLSWHDAFGFVALEAMACGLPVVTTRFAGAADLLEDGVSGVLVDPADPEAVYGSLRLLLDPELRRRIGGRAADVAAGHSEERNFDRVLPVLERARARAAGPVR